MTRADLVDDGRRAAANRSWLTAYEALTAVDEAEALAAADLELLGLAAFLAGRDAESDAARERAHQAFLALGEVEAAARVAYWLALATTLRGEPSRGAGWFARAQRVLDEAGIEESVWRGFLLVSYGMQALFAGRPGEALDLQDRAVAIGERFGDPDLRALAQLGRGQALIALGEVGRGLADIDELMVSLTLDELAPQIVGLAYCAVIETCHANFDIQRGQEWTTALDRWCGAQPQLVPYRGQCLVHRSELLALHGSWSEATVEAERARIRLTRPPPTSAAGMACYQRGELHRLRGEAAEAEAAFEAASRHGHDPQPGLALLRLEQGQPAVAFAGLQRAVAEAHPVRGQAHLLPALVEVALAAGDVAAAREAVDGLTEAASLRQAPMLAAAAATSAGAVLLAEHRWAEALRSLRQAFAGWQELHAPYEAARTRVLLGRTCRALGDEDSAALEFAAARWSFEQLGAVGDLARLDDLQRPSRHESARPPDGLTLRELEVLRLVATGATNRAIAGTLFLSESTVARHVANIFTKLGCSSRSAATAYAHRHALV